MLNVVISFETEGCTFEHIYWDHYKYLCLQIYVFLEHDVEKETCHIVIMIFQLQLLYKNQLESKTKDEGLEEAYVM